MRIGIVRTDIARIYLSDVENASQRDFSGQPKGQSRYFVHPTDAQLTAVLNKYALATLLGTNTSTFNTTGSNGTKLNIRTSTSASYVQVTVRSGAAVTAAQIVSDLNLSFKNAGIAALARVAGTSVAIDTTVGGPGVNLDLDPSTPSTATLQTVLGLSTNPVAGSTLAALKSAIYPSATTVNVASATVIGVAASLTNLSAAQQAALVGAVQDLVAPRLVETGPAIRSFAFGILSKMASSAFQPGGARSKLPAGIACVVLADDGSTPFVLA
jgi:hypothetical protein